MSEKTQPAYISKVHLKGYKSIRDVEIDLLPGLNIIIGPNGSGKTNFLELIEKIVSEENPDNSLIDSAFSQIFIKKSNATFRTELLVDSKVINDNITFTDVKTFITQEENDFAHPNPKIVLFSKNVNFQKLSFGILEQFFMINQSSKIEFIFERNGGLRHKLPPNLTSLFSFEILYLIKSHLETFFPEIDKITSEVFSSFNIDKYSEIFKAYSPVEKIRISNSAKINIEANSKVIIKDFFFEFFVKNKWLSWDQLSDGTKRILYIISEIYSTDNEEGIYLIDEPELGLHPHQIQLLLYFLKTQAKTKQIILTTHSPQILDVLKISELDRLIISRYDEKKGTEIFRLNDEEKKWMSDGLEDGLNFSDYWVSLGIDAENIG